MSGRGRFRSNRQAISRPTGGLRSYKPPTRRRPPQKDANKVVRRAPPRPRRPLRGVRNFGQSIIRGIRSTPQIRLAEAAVRGIQRL